MKIWLNEQYAIEQTDGNNLFGKGNDNFDFVEVYIPLAVYEQDNVIPVFIFERADKKKYGEFAHNVGTWEQDGYKVFKHILNGFVLAQKGNLDITIKLNFLKYVDEKRFIEKTKNLYVQGVVLNAIVVENEAFILSDEPEAFLTSLKYLLNDLNARIESGDITAERALADGNGNVITDTYATKAESEQVLADAKAYGDAVFETKGNVLSKVNTLKTEIQNGTVVANNAVEAVSYRDDENNLVVIKDKIENILYLINDVTGADLTGLQSKINALEVAWNNFMNGSESDDVIDTLNEIRNELASLDSASKKALYNLGANDSVVDNGDGTVTVSRNNGAYNETVAKGVPLITLDQQGSQWLKDEWEKGLQLFDKNNAKYGTGWDYDSQASDWVKVYDIPVKPNTTYSINVSANVSLHNGSDYTTSNTSTFTTNSDTIKIAICVYVGSGASEEVARTTFANLTLVKGRKAYDYQPYNANKHITNYAANFLKDESLKSANKWNEETQLGTLSHTDGSLESSTTRLCSKDFIAISSNTNYVFNTNRVSRICFYDSSYTFISTIVYSDTTFMTPSNAKYIKFDINVNYGTTYNNDIMLNKGSKAQPYHEFEGEIVRSKELEEQVEMLQTVIDALQTANNNLALRVSKLEGSVEFTGEQFVSGIVGSLTDTTGYFLAITSSFTIDGNVTNVSITYPERNSVSFSGSTITYTLRGEIAGRTTSATITYKYTASTSTASEEEDL